MAASKPNFAFQCIDNAITRGVPRSSYINALGENFADMEPWLIPIEGLAQQYVCKNTAKSGCRYRVVEHANGTLVGVCDEGRCGRREFAREELIRYRPDFARFRAELARLMGIRLEPYRGDAIWLIPVGDLAVGRDHYAVKLAGGANPQVLMEFLQKLWIEASQPQLILLASRLSATPELSAFLRKAQWGEFVLEPHMELKARALQWKPGSESHWLQCKRGLLTPEAAREEEGRTFLAMIEERIAQLDRGIGKLKAENAQLKDTLVGQFSTISQKVDAEYFYWILTVMATGSVSRAATALKMANSTFDEKLKRYRDRGGIYETLYQLCQVRRKGLGTKKLEQFNEGYLRHQQGGGSGPEVDLMRDVVDALEAQDEKNWPSVRDELLALLKEAT